MLRSSLLPLWPLLLLDTCLFVDAIDFQMAGYPNVIFPLPLLLTVMIKCFQWLLSSAKAIPNCSCCWSWWLWCWLVVVFYVTSFSVKLQCPLKFIQCEGMSFSCLYYCLWCGFFTVHLQYRDISMRLLSHHIFFFLVHFVELIKFSLFSSHAT